MIDLKKKGGQYPDSRGGCRYARDYAVRRLGKRPLA
jgi:hypothetical protein